MAVIPYLTGGEKPTPALMNRLVDELDRKLTKILYGKSPALIWPQNTGIPAQLVGKQFFFTSGLTRYAQLFYQAVNRHSNPGSSGFPLNAPLRWTPRPYDHATFTAALAGTTPTSYEEGTKIATVPTQGAARYTNGLPMQAFVGLFDHSLEAHQVTHPSTEQKYWVKETGIEHNEKIYETALAEIVIEGPTSVDLPAAWNKYNCFRLHNLNNVPASVSFGTAFSIDVPALGCRSVRRTSATGTYEAPLNYFFRYRDGDYRAWWHHPTFRASDALGARNIFGYDQWNPGNAMVANNISNAAILLEWLVTLKNGMKFQNDGVTVLPGTVNAGFEIDPHELCDIHELYEDVFGDPSSGAARLGDIVHHKGKLAIVKRHKTEKATIQGIEVPAPRTEVVDVEFKGYETIVADFAAKNLTVSRDGQNRYQVAKGPDSLEADWDYDLVPYGTNLFKNGDTFPSFYFDITTAPAVLPEQRLFDEQGDVVSLVSLAPPLFPLRTIGQVPRVFSYQTAAGGIATVTGDPTRTISTVPYGSRFDLAGKNVADYRVSDLLRIFADQNIETPNTAETFYSDLELKLTPQGFVLKCNDNFAAVPPGAVADAIANLPAPGRMSVSGNFFRVPKVIKFRGHGFPWAEAGFLNTGFLGGRYGRVYYSNGPANEIVGPHGADYSFGPLGAVKSEATILRPVKPVDLGNGGKNGRFWTISRDVDLFMSFTVNRKSLEAGYFAVWYNSTRAGFTVGTAPAPVMALLPEHYNLIAQWLNACKRGHPLNHQALRWYVGGAGSEQIQNLLPKLWVDQGVTALPMDCFWWDAFAAGSPQERLLRLLGVAIRPIADGNPEYTAARGFVPEVAEVLCDVAGLAGGSSGFFSGTATISNPRVIGNATSYRSRFPAGYTLGGPALQGYPPNMVYARVSDVRARVEALGFKMYWEEICEPLNLKLVELEADLSEGPGHEGNSFNYTDIGPPLHIFNAEGRFTLKRQPHDIRLPSDPQFPDVALADQGTPIYPTTTGSRVIFKRIYAFLPTRNAALARWKRRLVDTLVADATETPDTSPFYAFESASVRFLNQTDEQGPMGWSVGFNQQDNPALRFGNTRANVAIHYVHWLARVTVSEDQKFVDHLYPGFTRRTQASIAINSHSSPGLDIDTDIYFYPQGFFSIVNAQSPIRVFPGAGGLRIVSEPNWIPGGGPAEGSVRSSGPGIRMIQPPTSEDPHGSMWKIQVARLGGTMIL